MPFVPDFPLAKVHGAEYNPRRISDEAVRELGESIKRLGFVKPLILRPDGLTIAGHQRTKAARLQGFTTAPAFVIPNLPLKDEIRFNQLHNGTDLDDAALDVRIPPQTGTGYRDIDGAEVRGSLRSKGAIVRVEISKLLMRYGQWGAAVATQAGIVISSQHYALTCKLLKMPCRVFVVPDELEAEARRVLGQAYGEYSYEHLPRATYVQAFAQLNRLAEDKSLKQNTSTLYTQLVLPRVTKKDRILDFGCGRGDYVKSLSRKGYNIAGLEFFRKNGNTLDTKQVHRMVDDLLRAYTAYGPFDVVVCDSVLNSIDTLQAEADVLTCLNFFCRHGGRVYFSGRRRETQDVVLRQTKSTQASPKRWIEFMDEHGFTGLYRKGAWFFQRFHSAEEIAKLSARYFGDAKPGELRESMTWQACATKRIELPPAQIENALIREFNLPWPSGKSVNRHREAVEAMRGRYAC